MKLTDFWAWTLRSKLTWSSLSYPDRGTPTSSQQPWLLKSRSSSVLLYTTLLKLKSTLNIRQLALWSKTTFSDLPSTRRLTWSTYWPNSLARNLSSLLLRVIIRLKWPSCLDFWTLKQSTSMAKCLNTRDLMLLTHSRLVTSPSLLPLMLRVVDWISLLSMWWLTTISLATVKTMYIE